MIHLKGCHSSKKLIFDYDEIEIQSIKFTQRQFSILKELTDVNVRRQGVAFKDGYHNAHSKYL